MDGTISLGIHDAAGKLVRILHREADLDDFEIGQDALSTSWDGKDNNGQALPPGKYSARGYVVGELEVEGVGFFFNDWITDDHSPRIQKISGITMLDGRLILTAQAIGAPALRLVCDHAGKITATRDQPQPGKECIPPADLKLVEPVHCDNGWNQSLWVIDRIKPGASQVEVKQFSAGHELLRRLSISTNDAQPIQIAAAKDRDEIVLLEENETTQRLRRLKLLATASDQGLAVSDWKVELERKIVRHQNFTIEKGKPVAASGAAPPEKVAVILKENPLQDDKKDSVELAVGFDASGSFLKTADGLPLQTISETRNLTRVVLSSVEKNSVDVFQDDDAVVEQFRIRNLDEMMAFDCGEIELK